MMEQPINDELAQANRDQLEIYGIKLVSPMQDVKGIATDEGFIDIPKDKNAVEFIMENDGNRPPINDPRKDMKERAELTSKEIAEQEQATAAWTLKVMARQIPITGYTKRD